MKRLFRYMWPDGDVTIVYAASRADAAFVLDELGAASAGVHLKEIHHFSVTLSPITNAGDDDERWRLSEDQMGDFFHALNDDVYVEACAYIELKEKS